MVLRLRRYTSENRVKIGVFEKLGLFGPKFQVQGIVSHQPLLVSQIIEWIFHIWCKKFGRCFFLLSQFMRLTNGQTDGRTDLRLPIPRCVQCRAVKMKFRSFLNWKTEKQAPSC